MRSSINGGTNGGITQLTNKVARNVQLVRFAHVDATYLVNEHTSWVVTSTDSMPSTTSHMTTTPLAKSWIRAWAAPLAHQAAGVLERWLLTLLDAAVFVHFAIVIPALHSRLSDRNQIWHTYSDGYGTDSNLKKFDPPDPRGCQGGF